MLPSRGCVFQQDNQNHIMQLILQHGFVVEEHGCWIGCLQSDLHLIENIWWSLIKKYVTRRPQTLQQLDTYIRACMGPKQHRTHNSMPRRLQTVFKRELHHNKHAPSHYFETCSRHNICNELILCITNVTLLSLNICYVIYVLLWIPYWLMWF